MKVSINVESGTLELNGQKIPLKSGSTFQVELGGDIAEYLQLSPDQQLAFALGRSFAGTPAARGPGRPRKNGAAPARPAAERPATKRTGKSLWSGKENFNPRYGHLTRDEMVLLGITSMTSSAAKRLFDGLRKAQAAGTWDGQRPKLEAALARAKDDDERAERMKAIFEALGR